MRSRVNRSKMHVVLCVCVVSTRMPGEAELSTSDTNNDNDDNAALRQPT